MFAESGADKVFENELKKFSRARTKIYKDHSHILRARDSIAGEIGEYFAISRFNSSNPELPLIRLKNSYRDIDAVQMKNGKTYAIKTLGKFPGTTSNIWSKDIEEAVDFFLIVHLDPFDLLPKFICKISSKNVVGLGLKKDSYQKSFKISVTKELLKKAEFILGKKEDWV
jgi:hypothetical protein